MRKGQRGQASQPSAIGKPGGMNRRPELLSDKIWHLVFGKETSRLRGLLNMARMRGTGKEAFMETLQALTEGKVQ